MPICFTYSSNCISIESNSIPLFCQSEIPRCWDILSVKCDLFYQVTVLPDPNVQQNLENESENWVSNLGKITVVCNEKRQAAIVATKINADLLGSDKSVICLQIPTDFDINLLVTKELVRNDLAYLNTVREINRAFLSKYDLKKLDHNDKYQYLDRPSGNPTRIRDSVLIANGEAHNNSSELLPRLRCYNMTAPVVPPKPLTGRPGSGKKEYKLSKDTTGDVEKLGIYDDVKLSDLEEKNFEYKKLQESISDDSFNDSSDDGYEKIDDLEYEEIDDIIVTLPYRMSETSHDYEDMSSDEECNTASPGGTRVKPAKTKSKDSGKVSVLSALKLKFRSKRFNCENLHESVDGDKKSSRQQSVSIDLSAPRSKSDGTDSLRTTKTESKTKIKLPIHVPKTKQPILSHSVTTLGDPLHKTLPVYPTPKIQSCPPFPQQQIAAPLRKTLSVSYTAKVASTLETMVSPPKRIPSIPKQIPSTPKSIPSTVLDQPVFKPLSASSLVSTDDFFDVPIPKDLASLSVQGVGRVLASLNMACYINKFEEEQIDGEMLMELDEGGLKSLDLKPFQVLKLVKVISGWRPNFGRKRV